MKTNKICVIGGSGFIGQHLVKLLVKQKRDIIVVGRKKKPENSLPAGVEYCSYTENDQFWPNLISKVNEIICLAYTSTPLTSFVQPADDIVTNLLPFVKLLHASSQQHLKKFVLVSSGGAVYGTGHSFPITEEHPTNPISPYGITKLALEKYALMYHKTAGLPVVIVRPSNCYGPGQRPFIGQGFIATAIASAIIGKEIVIFGKNGTIRDYIFVTDAAKGILSVLNHGKIGQHYNLGSGVGTSNVEIVKKIAPLAKIHGLKLKLKILPQRPFDVKKNILNSSYLEQSTGWLREVNLNEGLKLTWEWLISNPSLYEKN